MGRRRDRLFQTPETERFPEISPDGRWLAYGSNLSGPNEVYVRPYPGPGPAESVSIDGGGSPAWHPSGKELFFVGRSRAGKETMMAVDFEAGSLPPFGSARDGPSRVKGPLIGRPRPLFEFDTDDLSLVNEFSRCYDVAPDGRSFYAIQWRTPSPQPVVTHVNLIQNWFEELKAKVPGGVAKQAHTRVGATCW